MEIFIIILICWLVFGAFLLHSVKTDTTKENKKRMKESLKSMPIVLRFFTYIFVVIYFLIVYLITPISILILTLKKK